MKKAIDAVLALLAVLAAGLDSENLAAPLLMTLAALLLVLIRRS